MKTELFKNWSEALTFLSDCRKKGWSACIPIQQIDEQYVVNYWEDNYA